ncbi:MAG: IS110 family transposase, partial [Gammaproteobacteria bacterium]|nr:IS110 family transposase [Gammaproteobacteria bacterium]
MDLAKNVFHIVCCNQAGKLVKKKQLRRSQVLSYFAQLPASLVGME